MVHVQSYVDHNTARINMVHGLLRPNQVVEERIVEAILTTPREKFLPKEVQNISYIDSDLSLGEGRFLMSPLTFSRLVQASMIQEDDVVLDIGCGMGYSTAILGKLASSVIGIDEKPEFLSNATEELSKLEILNCIFHCAHLKDGFPKGAPYSLIFLEGAVDFVPEYILNQLAENGRLMAIVTINAHQAVARLYQRIGQHFAHRDLFDVNAKPLHGFQQLKEFKL
ncbi:MAG: protein-L-isoaspartate O-methyltransferase [Alphaproteobacteria bacterium]|nr:protein-L-isoaspartate O-methyltransferase [Alphaproteobacteria bacterium]